MPGGVGDTTLSLPELLEPRARLTHLLGVAGERST